MYAGSSLADVFRPSEKLNKIAYDLALVTVGSVFIALCAQAALWLPFSPVPVTGQTLAVVLVGTLLGARRGSLCVIIYLAEGLLGIPVFASARAGIAVLLGPTGGYLCGFILAAWITGYLAEKGWDRRPATAALSMLFGNLAIYLPGLMWLGCLIGSSRAIAVGLIPFVPGDLVKIALATLALPLGWKIIGLVKPEA